MINRISDPVSNRAINIAYIETKAKPIWWYLRCDDRGEKVAVTITYGTTDVVKNLHPEQYEKNYEFKKSELMSIIPLETGETLKNISLFKLINIERQAAIKRDETRKYIFDIIEKEYRGFRNKEKFTESLKFFETLDKELETVCFLEAFVWMMRKPRSRDDISRLTNA